MQICEPITNGAESHSKLPVSVLRQSDRGLWNVEPNRLCHTFPTLIITGAQFNRSLCNFPMRDWTDGNMDIEDLPWEEFVVMIGRANRCHPMSKREPLKGRCVQSGSAFILYNPNVASHEDVGTCILNRKNNIENGPT